MKTTFLIVITIIAVALFSCKKEEPPLNIQGYLLRPYGSAYELVGIDMDSMLSRESLTIPERISGKSIVRLGTGSISNKPFRVVYLSNNVTEIGDNCFAQDTLLQLVAFGSGIKSIGSRAFLNCTAIESMAIPSTVTVINYSTFNGCTALKLIKIEDNVTNIQDGAFFGCKKLDAITLPRELVEIGSDAFNDCVELKEITIPSKVNLVDYYAFKNCIALKSVTMLNPTPPTLGITYDSPSAFTGCNDSLRIYVPESSMVMYSNSPWNKYPLDVSTPGGSVNPDIPK